MFFISRKLGDEEFIEAIKAMKEGRDKRAFENLRDTYNPLLSSIFRSVTYGNRDKSELQQIQFFIERVFWEILDHVDLTKNISQIKKYLETVLKSRINKTTVDHELGKDHEVKLIRHTTEKFNSALKKFHISYKRAPDFNDEGDIQILSRIMDIEPDKVKEMIALVKKDKKLYDVIGQDNEGNVETLMDTISNGDPLPDEIYDQKELLKAFAQSIQRYLSPDERKVYTMYYLTERGITQDELAEKLDLKLDRIKYLLETGENKLKKSPVLKELYNVASLRKTMIRMAMNTYRHIRFADGYRLVKMGSESIISEVLNARK